MNKLIFLLAIPLLVFFNSGCRENNAEPIAAQNEINTFIWGSMNSWYYWQNEVVNLKDTHFEDLSSLHTFLNTFNQPADLFESLRHTDDRFSWIVDDYIALQNTFQGTSKSFGFEYGLVRLSATADSVVGYVQYVLPASPAEAAGLKRGDLFYAVNGVRLTTQNYRDMRALESYSLALCTYQNLQLTPTTNTPVMNAVLLTENPVLLAKTLLFENKKIGYIVYTGFTHTFHSELNAAFAQLQAEGAEELVLDLRYNPGGSIYTALFLGSMIYNQANEQDILAKLVYNAKHPESNFDFPFFTELYVLNGNYDVIRTEPLARLSLNRVYFLTGRGTASASELIINGLDPYMETRQIGATTVGKNEASVTLYDSPASNYRDEKTANPNHLWAIQPIVAKLTNVVGFGDYVGGIVPDIALDEVSFFNRLMPLGDPNETLLHAALLDIAGLPGPARVEAPGDYQLIDQSLQENQHEGGMVLNGLDWE